MDFDFFVIFNSALQDWVFFLPYSFSNINYDNQCYDVIITYVWNFRCWNSKICVRCDMAFFEPMHHNKSNIRIAVVERLNQA